jgi:hypothetical protein
MGQSLNAWCDDDLNDQAASAAIQPMVLPEVVSPTEAQTTITIPEKAEDIIDLSKLFEEFDARVKDYEDLARLKEYIQSTGTMNRSLALEACAIYPSFDERFKETAFTKEPTSIGMEMALDNINAGMAAMVAAAVVAIGAIIWKLVRVFGGKSKSKDGKDGKVSADIRTVPSSRTAEHENEARAKTLEEASAAVKKTMEELLEVLHDAGMVFDRLSIQSMDDLDAAFIGFLKMRSTHSTLAGLAPTSPISAAVRVGDSFCDDLVDFYEGSLDAAEATLKKLVEAEVVLEDLLKSTPHVGLDGVYLKSADKKKEGSATHVGDVAEQFNEAKADVVIGGRTVNASERLTALKKAAKKLEDDYTSAAEKVEKLSILLRDFYDHDIKAQLSAVNKLSANNDRVITALQDCDEVYRLLETKIDSKKLTASTGSAVLAYTKALKSAADAIKAGGTFAQAVREKWIEKTPPLTQAMLAFIKKIIEHPLVLDDEELRNKIKPIKINLQQAHAAIVEAKVTNQ